MKKSLVAFLCTLALLAGLLPATVTAAAEEGDSYQVGYSKKDLNPFIKNEYTGDLGIENQTYADADTYVGTVQIHNPNNTSEIVEVPFVKTPMSGYGTVSTRLADKMTDDNGDGIIGLGDGIFCTATSVTDDWGNTVIYINMDYINGYATLSSTVRTSIVAALGSDVIKSNQIIFTGSHTHEGPTLSSAWSSWHKNMNTGNKNATGDVTALGSYWLYVVDQMTAAAVEAYNTRSEATMTKGEISAPEAMKTMGYTYTDSSHDNYGEGFMLNSVRHYDVKKTVRTLVEKKEWYQSDYSTTSDTTTTTSWVAGDNFATVYQPGTTTTEDEVSSGSWLKTYTRTTVTTTYETDHVSEVNDTMYLLKFDRAEGDPVVLVNWRAHASICGNSGYTNISSDYINALRYRLENNTSFGGDTNYCVGFWQAASGNVNNTSKLTFEYSYKPAAISTGVGYTTITLDDNGDGQDDVKVPWEADATDFYADYYAGFVNTSGTATYADQIHRNALYGYLLGKVALQGMETGMTTGLDHGKIHAVQNNYMASPRTYTDAEIAAATQWKTDYDAGTTITYPYSYTYNGTSVALNSYYHAYAILNRSSSSTKMELNAIAMGENVALVTGPGEQFDRYSTEHTTGNTADNDWLDLNNADTYDTPFVLSYSNGSTGYSPNLLAYNYYTDKTGTVPTGTAMGSYEANTTGLAPGTGELLIDQFQEMLSMVYNAFVMRHCPSCNEVVEWTPLTPEQGNTPVAAGHYYLTGNLTGTTQAGGQWSIGDTDGEAPQTTCIDLMGYAKTSVTRNFIVNKNSTLSIMDSVGGGYIQGQTFSNNPGGGNISVAGGGTFNLYGGTLKFVTLYDTTYYGTGRGGNILLSGTMNMYGGCVEGADMVDSTYGEYEGSGGAIYVSSSSAKLNVYGGEITSGSVPETGKGPCVYLAGSGCKILVSGDAKVEDIYYNGCGGANLTISGAFTGSLGLTFDPTNAPITDNMDIGNSTNAVLTGSTITCTNNPMANVYVHGTNLLLSNPTEDTVAMVYGSDGVRAYNSLTEAVTNYSQGYIKLIKEETAAVSVTKNVYLDLAGYDISGKVTVNSGYTLYVMDSETDDYTVEDEKYGKISSYEGQVAGVPEEATCADDGYLMIAEDDGVSFHRVNLDVYAMTLRPEVNGKAEPGIYYKSYFAGDELVAANVKNFGVALSVSGTPTADNLDSKCQYSTFENFQSGEGSNDTTNTGTLLYNIMKADNMPLINSRNANTNIYGRAYILLNDGTTYMFGGGVSRTLRQQVEAINAGWNTLTDAQRTPMAAMCQNFESVTKNWSISKILEAIQSGENEVLKVLVLGNSHGLDATNLLYEVFKTEAPDQKVVLGALYYSGCNMAQHASYITNNTAAYDYYKNDGSNADGSWTITNGVTAKYGLQDEKWDIVVMQQMNHRAGRDADYVESNFLTVKNYILNNTEPDATLMWHMVWANPDQEEYLDPDSTLSHPTKTSTAWVDNHNEWFPGEDGTYDMDVLYSEILRCTQQYIPEFVGENTEVIPSATAVQFALNKLGLTQANIYRDYTHMNDYGRLMVAYLWYAKLMGLNEISAVNISEIPSVLHHSKSAYPEDLQITEDMQGNIETAVNWALANPYTLEQQ